MTELRFTCPCGATESPRAQDCTLALRAGRPYLVAACALTGRPAWVELTDANLSLMLTSPVLLDPDVRDYLNRKASL